MEHIYQENILNDRLNLFYKNDFNFKTLHDIYINPRLSLRVIDWFVTNFSKKNNVTYDIPFKYNTKHKFNVYTSYKSQLKSYSKKFFDPFCRRERIDFGNGNSKMVTTIGQLNFFKWAIDYKILDYINENYEMIDKDMNNCMSIHNTLKKKSGKKRKELSKSSYMGLNTQKMDILLYFD
jgi:hypothetical protein